MRIAFTTLACPAWDMDRIIAAGTECGYDGIDFRGYLGELDVHKLPEFTTNAATTARSIADAGLAVSAFSSSAKMYAPEESQRAAAIEHLKVEMSYGFVGEDDPGKEGK